MSNLFATIDNTYVIAANTTSGTATVTIPNAGQFMLDNTGNVPVFIGHGVAANTANAVIPTTGTATHGFWIEPNQTKWFNTTQTNNFTAPNRYWYVTGITASGTAQVYVTGCFANP